MRSVIIGFEAPAGVWIGRYLALLGDLLCDSPAERFAPDWSSAEDLQTASASPDRVA